MTEFDDNGKIIFNLNALKYTKASYFEILVSVNGVPY